MDDIVGEAGKLHFFIVLHTNMSGQMILVGDHRRPVVRRYHEYESARFTFGADDCVKKHLSAGLVRGVLPVIYGLGHSLTTPFDHAAELSMRCVEDSRVIAGRKLKGVGVGLCFGCEAPMPDSGSKVVVAVYEMRPYVSF
jgi:hypothetical protein